MKAMQPSVDDVFGASQKIGLTRTTFLVYILPPLVCLYVMGVLVQLKGTRFYRLALLPVLVWFSWRDSESVYTALWNAWDLMVNARGIGWNWPQGIVVPKPTFKTDSRVVFVFLSAARLALYALGFDASLQIMRRLSPDTFGSLDGGSLFDHTLPPLLELLRAVFVSSLTACMAYFAIQWSYQLIAIVCIILFQQRPSQWPPLFDAPWKSTSLTELWGRRWHQMMRELLVTLGIRPFGYLFGRLGGLFGAFLVSGVFHDIELRSFGRGGNFVAIVGFWVMNSVGVVLERLWTKQTGRRVGGVWGRIWTFGWLALWGVWVVDEWAKAGRFGALSLPGDMEPSVVLASVIRSIYVKVFLTLQ
ncbi:hypothetical protein OG21DRAFT_1509617 [Imleria badia]|nr:hypothetical protein OG21DRAFT_1509617 [Imleria badia]